MKSLAELEPLVARYQGQARVLVVLSRESFDALKYLVAPESYVIDGLAREHINYRGLVLEPWDNKPYIIADLSG